DEPRLNRLDRVRLTERIDPVVFLETGRAGGQDQHPQVGPPDLVVTPVDGARQVPGKRHPLIQGERTPLLVDPPAEPLPPQRRQAFVLDLEEDVQAAIGTDRHPSPRAREGSPDGACEQRLTQLLTVLPRVVAPLQRLDVEDELPLSLNRRLRVPPFL